MLCKNCKKNTVNGDEISNDSGDVFCKTHYRCFAKLESGKKCLHYRFFNTIKNEYTFFCIAMIYI